MGLTVDLVLPLSRSQWTTPSLYDGHLVRSKEEIVQEKDQMKLETSNSTDADVKNLAGSS